MDGGKPRRFVGSKGGAGVAQRIICWMPPHDVYVEPFAGLAAVFRLKRLAKRSILIDLDQGTLGGIPGTPGVEVEKIRGDGVAFLRYCAGLTEGVGPNPKVESTMVYADPPYLRTSRRDVQPDYYRHEWTAEQHEEFLAVAVKLPCNVLISGYRSTLYTKRLRGWHTDRFRTMTRGGPAEEWLWANYPRPSTLHDYRFIGRRFEERWRIHKRQRSWVRMLRKMPPLERRAMLSRLIDEFGGEVLIDEFGGEVLGQEAGIARRDAGAQRE